MKMDLESNAPIEVFPFVTTIHREVVLRHHDGDSQDIEMTPDEADRLADVLREAAAEARSRVLGDEPDVLPEPDAAKEPA